MDSAKRESGRRPPIAQWLSDPLPKDVAERIHRMSTCEDVFRVAVMPDAHLAEQYCVGTVVATRSRIMPQAVGGDIGCGMLAARFEAAANRLLDQRAANQLLQLLLKFVPTNRHRAQTVNDQLPDALRDHALSTSQLQKLACREGRVQLGTLGRGNHFLELQCDEQGALWIMIHSGSRHMGQAITSYHLRRATVAKPLPYLEADSELGQQYLNDVAWAQQYAHQNRRAMLWVVAELLQTLWGVDVDEGSFIESDHNHVRQERHEGRLLWIHRKGAQSAAQGDLGVIPGSMGSTSYHVLGRGCHEALKSSSHGAGRRYSRSEARRRVGTKALRREMGGVFFMSSRANTIRDEAPSAYKNIHEVMRAQRDLVKSIRTLQPMLSYKGV